MFWLKMLIRYPARISLLYKRRILSLSAAPFLRLSCQRRSPVPNGRHLKRSRLPGPDAIPEPYQSIL